MKIKKSSSSFPQWEIKDFSFAATSVLTVSDWFFVQHSEDCGRSRLTRRKCDQMENRTFFGKSADPHCGLEAGMMDARNSRSNRRGCNLIPCSDPRVPAAGILQMCVTGSQKQAVSVQLLGQAATSGEHAMPFPVTHW
jgi:hypothetical protein